MGNWTINYRDDFKSFWIEAKDDYSDTLYVFTTHALERAWTRSSNINTMQDFNKPVRRIIRCMHNNKVSNWIKTRKHGSTMVIHDADINMVYVISNHYKTINILTIYNEFWEPFKCDPYQQEMWISINSGKMRIK